MQNRLTIIAQKNHFQSIRCFFNDFRFSVCSSNVISVLGYHHSSWSSLPYSNKKTKFNLLCKFFHCLLFSSFLWEQLERGSKFSRKISKTFHQQFYFSHHREPQKNEFPSKPMFSSKRTILRKLIKFQNCAKVLNPILRTTPH